jgi:hypothetical protein
MKIDIEILLIDIFKLTIGAFLVVCILLSIYSIFLLAIGLISVKEGLFNFGVILLPISIILSICFHKMGKRYLKNSFSELINAVTLIFFSLAFLCLSVLSIAALFNFSFISLIQLDLNEWGNVFRLFDYDFPDKRLFIWKMLLLVIFPIALLLSSVSCLVSFVKKVFIQNKPKDK